MVEKSGADVIVELIGGSDGIALKLCETAIAKGKSIVTANKAMIAHHGTELARAAETLGFHTAWMAETQHNPFLACALIAEHSQRLSLGTAIAVSFARSPAVMAHTAWDLAEHSQGRFHLGLGTQVRAHIERRFGMPWPASPVGKLREQIAAMRAFWANWQTGAPLNQRGDHYKLTLTAPFFTPQPIEDSAIPIWIAGVNQGLARLAGEVAEGFLVHPYHSDPYLQEHILPAIREGEQKSGRELGDTKIMVNAFVVTNEKERAYARRQIAFYASTPSYRSVMAWHGWEEVAERLSALAARQRWDEMPALVGDEMLLAFATVTDEADVAAALQARYGAFADRLTLYIPFIPGERDDFWRSLTRQLNHV